MQHETCKLTPTELTVPAEHVAAHEADTAVIPEVVVVEVFR